jgi:restriction system protein
MPIPDYQTLMLPTLKLGATGEIKLKDAYTILSEEFNLSEDERQHLLPSGKMTTIRNRVAWAVVYLVKAGLLMRPKRGLFTITDRGKGVLSKNPVHINAKFLKQYPEFVKFTNAKTVKTDSGKKEIIGHDVIETPEERIDSAYQEIVADIKSELLSKILEASPEFFERLIVNLLVAMGYGGSSVEAGKHLGKSGDNGIDGVIKEDKLGLDMIYVQAKRYAPKNSIGRPAINGFVGSLVGFGANKGVFVTTSSFSKHAYGYAENVPQRIILIDGEKLTSLMLEHNVGVRINQSIELKRVDEDFFMED